MSSVAFASSELWSQTYGGTERDLAYSVIETSDGGYAIAGTTNSSGARNFDFWLVKTDADGNVLWNQTYGDDDYDCAYSLVETSDGGYLLAGSTWSFGAYTLPGGYGSNNFWLVKTDVNGTLQWTKTYGGDYSDIAYSVVQTSDGGYALAGTYSDGFGNENFWLVKTDINGTMQWNQTYGGSGEDIAQSLAATSDGGYVLAGSTDSFGAGNRDFWLVKTDANGTMQWNMTYGETYTDFANSVIETSDGGYALVGSTFSGYILINRFWLIKTDQYGVMQWNQTYQRMEFDPDKEQPSTETTNGEIIITADFAQSLIETSDRGFAIVGETSTGDETGDFWLVKTDANGIAQWNQTYGGISRETPYSIIETSDGGYAIAGYTRSFGAGMHDFWLIKTDEYGVVPEFSSWIILPFIITGAFIVAIYKKKLPKTTN